MTWHAACQTFARIRFLTGEIIRKLWALFSDLDDWRKELNVEEIVYGISMVSLNGFVLIYLFIEKLFQKRMVLIIYISHFFCIFYNKMVHVTWKFYRNAHILPMSYTML